MVDSKPQSQSSDRRRKRKYLSDGTSSKRYIEGPGVWVSCIKGKERQTVGELYDIFDSVASDIWPIDHPHLLENKNENEDSRDNSELSIEEQINAEVTAVKRPRSEQRFASCQTNTPCVVFISCRSPVDPVQLVETHIQNVKSTGAARTRYTHRFVPVSGTCYTDLSDIQTLCKSTLKRYLACDNGTAAYTYKIELRMRNHTTLERFAVIQAIAECVPERYKVNLTDPQLFILVEIFKSVCGMSIATNYYTLHKYNVMEVAHDFYPDGNEAGRV
ncbi:hypothetical protein J3R30DRAFT_3485071 [Lentinula aciculospora]|uniref:THUMP domain-containing protein n=1 Tax=Lentinula aciculospora TaxID=153920 RepID=A0A9W9DN02_9AGAR|nr:hypothetical protein J3R30DRAFT_3485071 [Lentinula aciculospora]